VNEIILVSKENIEGVDSNRVDLLGPSVSPSALFAPEKYCKSSTELSSSSEGKANHRSNRTPAMRQASEWISKDSRRVGGF
jgi:hypothetical protein